MTLFRAIVAACALAVAVNMVAADRASAQSAWTMETSVQACTNFGPGGNLVLLKIAGWDRISGDQISPRDRSAIASSFLIGFLSTDHVGALPESEANRAAARTELLISRASTTTTTFSTVLLRHRTSSSILIHETKSRPNWKEIGCKILVRNGDEHFIIDVAHQTGALDGQATATLIPVGERYGVNEGVESSVKLWLWNNSTAPTVFGPIHPLGGIVSAKVWKAGSND